MRCPTILPVWQLNTWAVVFAVLGASLELVGLWTVAREIANDRRRGRDLLDKQRRWKPERRPPPRHVSASAINVRPSGLGTLQSGALERQIAGLIASLVSGHNQLVRDSEDALDLRTGQLLDEIDKGDKEMRNVLQEMLGEENIRQRVIGVLAIAGGITLSMIASVLSSLG